MVALLQSYERAGELGARATPIERTANRNELSLAHTASHIERIEATAGRSVLLDSDTQTSPQSYETALRACGAVLELCDRLVDGVAKTAFSAARPPGHHAETNRAMGFCLFSNVAIAARYLRERHGLRRVAVVDYDVHHGNGTQEVLLRDPESLFISLHQSPLYPGTGAIDELGEGDGRGFTINVPLPPGCDDTDYAAVMGEIVIPALSSYEPEFLLVSAGFDAHVQDPLGSMNVTDDGYAWMTSRLLGVANEMAGGRCLAVLEGGYDIAALKSSVERVVGVMSGDGSPDVVASNNVDRIIEAVRSTHSGLGLL